jgi:hypothetical protein
MFVAHPEQVEKTLAHNRATVLPAARLAQILAVAAGMPHSVVLDAYK